MPCSLRCLVVVLVLLVTACSASGDVSEDDSALSTPTAEATTAAPEVHDVPEDGFTVVNVFLEDSMMNDSGTDLSPAGLTLMSDLAGIDGVLEVWLVDKIEAMDEARALFSDDPEFLAALDSNPRLLPASIRVRVADRTAQMAVVEEASDWPGVKEVGTWPPP